jgi:hypothetical protein
MSNALPLQLRGRFVPGALRAAPILPLLLALNAAQPAHAQLPRPSAEVLPAVTVTAPAIVNIDTGTDASPLTLLANHVDIRIVGTQARVRTTLTWRNNGPVPVEATYRAPLPSALARLVVDDFDGCGDALDAREADDNDEAAEAGETASGGRALVLLAPGEEVRVTVEREAALIARGDRQRLVLPLFTQRNGAFTPQFSATASIDAERPIVELSSGTHPVEVSGLGEPQARAVIPNGRVYEGQFLALDFKLGTATAAEPPPTISARGWGGEGFARVVAR